MQYGAGRVNGQCFPEMILRQLVFLLSEINRAQTIPGVVMTVIVQQGLSKRFNRLLQIFVVYLLVPTERVRVRKRRIQLQGPLEEFDRCVGLPLQGEAVADNTPRLRGEFVHLDDLLGQGAQLLVALEVPQGCGERLQSAQTEWLGAQHLPEGQHRGLVFIHLIVGLADPLAHQSSTEMPLRQGVQLINAGSTAVQTEHLIGPRKGDYQLVRGRRADELTMWMRLVGVLRRHVGGRMVPPTVSSVSVPVFLV